MLEGTEIGSAYAPIIGSNDGFHDGFHNGFHDGFNDKPPPQVEKKPAPKIRLQEENAINQQLQQIAAIQKKQNVPAPQQNPMVNQYTNQPQGFDSTMFNRQFENQMQQQQQQQQLAMLVNEIKKQKTPQAQEETYVDKLMAKKKDVLKFLQSGLIILFAISLHFIIDFFLKHYLQTYDVSWNREVFIRILYPVGILFVAWNIIALTK
jgi:hypothetical protein